LKLFFIINAKYILSIVSSQFPGDKTLTACPGATIRYVANVPEVFPNQALKNKSIANQVWARGKLLKEFRRKPFKFPLGIELLNQLFFQPH